MKMCIVTAHAGAESLKTAVESWTNLVIDDVTGMCPPTLIVPTEWGEIYVINGNPGMLPAYQHGFGMTQDYDVVGFLHDDTIIKDPGWIDRVLKEFEDPTVGLVGFGGAMGHGDPAMYRKPYEYQQLGRREFFSNMVDWQNHGQLFTGNCDVAVLDGFAMFVRRSVLEKAGGWPLGTPIGYVCYDYWLSCMTRRLGYRIRLAGVSCQHLGGQTFVKMGIGQDPKHWKQYVDSHRYIYDEFKDVLPYEVPR